MKEELFLWQVYTFSMLNTKLLYDILKLRVNVFVVEQNCVYPELDGYDEESDHIFFEENGNIICYARILPPGVKYDDVSIGRVIVSPDYRNQGLGYKLMDQCLAHVDKKWSNVPIQLQAQAHLQKFYESFNFKAISDVYDEDGIPHVDMKRM